MTDPAACPGQEPSIDRQMATGAVWMLFARGLDRAIGLASIAILARLLVPADFGLVAMASVVVAVLELVGMYSFDIVLIQNPAATRRHFDTAWTFNAILGASIAAALLVAAAPAARLYGEPRLEAVIACLALGTFVQGFENIGTVMFRKELRFSREFNLVFAKRLIVFAVTIPAALLLRSYWALVIGIVLGRTVGVALTYWVHPYRPRFSLAARSELFHFGKWLVANNLLNFAGNRSADFLLGKISGPAELGIFNLSYEISTIPTNDLVGPINRAIFPGYALKAAEPEALRRSYLDVVGAVALFAVPAGVGIAALAHLVVPLMLGPQWSAAVVPVAFLSFYGVLLALKSNNHFVYLAMGRPRLATFLGTIQVALLLPMIAVGSARRGALGAAMGYLLAQALFTPISLGVLLRTLRLRFGALVGVFYRPIVASAVMFGALRIVSGAVPTGGVSGAGLILPLLLGIATGATVYCATVWGLWRAASRPAGAERRVIGMVGARLRRSRGRSLHLAIGETVEVRSEREILATLDADGAVDGLPFMPEMLAFCGRRLRVGKRADKTCDTIHYSGSRRMWDTVHLEGTRCSGAAHGGCQARCLLFWKEAWLKRPGAGSRPTEADDPPPAGDAHGPAGLRCSRQRLDECTRAPEPGDGEVAYRCQATDLLRASAPMAWWDPRQYLRDVLTGNVGVGDVLRALLFRGFRLLLRFRGYRALMWCYNRLHAAGIVRPYPFLYGTLDKTPRETLGLRPGEWVEVKSQQEILATLNKRNRNLGLSFDAEMVRYCGGRHRVLGRVERIIDESSGRMIHLSNDCILLEGAICKAEYSDKRLFCPRGLYPFWREIWLRRVPGPGAGEAAGPREAAGTLVAGRGGEDPG